MSDSELEVPPEAPSVERRPDEDDRSPRPEQKIDRHFGRARIDRGRDRIGSLGKGHRLGQGGCLQIGRNREKDRPLPSSRGVAKERIQHGAKLFRPLELQALLGDRLKKPDMLHAMPRRPGAFG